MKSHCQEILDLELDYLVLTVTHVGKGKRLYMKQLDVTQEPFTNYTCGKTDGGTILYIHRVGLVDILFLLPIIILFLLVTKTLCF